jgi:hypothetical protein
MEWQVSLYYDAHESGLEGVRPSLFCMDINFLEYSLKKSKLLPFVVWRCVQFVEHEGGCFRNKSLVRGQEPPMPASCTGAH